MFVKKVIGHGKLQVPFYDAALILLPFGTRSAVCPLLERVGTDIIHMCQSGMPYARQKE